MYELGRLQEGSAQRSFFHQTYVYVISLASCSVACLLSWLMAYLYVSSNFLAGKESRKE